MEISREITRALSIYICNNVTHHDHSIAAKSIEPVFSCYMRLFIKVNKHVEISYSKGDVTSSVNKNETEKRRRRLSRTARRHQVFSRMSRVQ